MRRDRNHEQVRRDENHEQVRRDGILEQVRRDGNHEQVRRDGNQVSGYGINNYTVASNQDMNVSTGCLVDNQSNGNTGQDYAHTSHDGGTGDPNHCNGNHYSYVTQMMSCTNSQLRRMPITSSNDLPHCSLILGRGRSKCLLSVDA